MLGFFPSWAITEPSCLSLASVWRTYMVLTLVGTCRSSTAWIFFCTGFILSFVSRYPEYSISGEKKEDFYVLIFNPALRSLCNTVLSWHRWSSNNVELLMNIKSSRYVRTKSTPSISMGIYSWKLSRDTLISMDRHKYWYLPYGVLIVHIVCESESRRTIK